MFYTGCPAWGYKEWVGHDNFFPPKTPASEFLRLYSRKLTTVEGNTTFYAVPTADTVAHWQQETPETFRFCPKIPRSISHEPHIDTRKDETLAFVERMRGLGTRLGPIFLQLPPAFSLDHLSTLETFLGFWPHDVRLAVEVRHPSFYTEKVTETLNVLLQRYNVGRVLMDTRPIRTGTEQEQHMLQARERKPNLPLQIVTTTDFAFVRYIGHPKMEVNALFLDQWAQQCEQWLTQGLTLYVFCHCPFEIHSPNICLDLYQRLTKVISLPALPWQKEHLDQKLEQRHLF
ncbi:MAG: DUF72 domain-containing protein [Ktedonobacteraceae bacterium]